VRGSIVPKPLTFAKIHSRYGPTRGNVVLLVLIDTLQKEPKLTRARQIPEWTSYDNEIAEFARSLADSGKIRSRAISGSVDALASVGKKVAASEETPVAVPEAQPAEARPEHEEL
jgi:hypothetical protein